MKILQKYFLKTSIFKSWPEKFLTILIINMRCNSLLKNIKNKDSKEYLDATQQLMCKLFPVIK